MREPQELCELSLSILLLIWMSPSTLEMDTMSPRQMGLEVDM